MAFSAWFVRDIPHNTRQLKWNFLSKTHSEGLGSNMPLTKQEITWWQNNLLWT